MTIGHIWTRSQPVAVPGLDISNCLNLRVGDSCEVACLAGSSTADYQTRWGDTEPGFKEPLEAHFDALRSTLQSIHQDTAEIFGMGSKPALVVEGYAFC